MEKILIVDDNLPNLYLLENILRSRGYEVSQAENGLAALEIARNDPPDLIISDILMPVMDGFTLCRNWLADEHLKFIPFIFYTATYTDGNDEKFALSLGADRFLIKPFPTDELLSVVKEVLNAPKKVFPPLGDGINETTFYKDYSAVLIHKLEDKMYLYERANRRIETLYQASCNLVSNKPCHELIHKILTDLFHYPVFQHIRFYSYMEGNSDPVLLDSVGLLNDPSGQEENRGVFQSVPENGFLERAAKTRQSIHISDTRREPQWLSGDPRIFSALYIPVNFESIVFGVLAIFNQKAGAFHKEDEESMLTFANSMAVCMHNRGVESKLIEEQTFFQTLMDNIPDRIYFKNLQSRFIRANQALAIHLGVNKPSELIDKTDFDYFSEEHASPAYKDEQQIISTGQPIINLEEIETWADRQSMWVSTTKMPFRDSTGRIIGTFGISRDITERKKNESELRESEERFKSFFVNAMDAIILTSEDGDIFAANPSACKIFGRTEAEMISCNREILVDTSDPRISSSFLERIRNNNAMTELTFIRKDGRRFEGEITSSIYEDRHGDKKSIVIIRDITRRKQMELSLELRLMELETVNQLSLRLRGGDTVEKLIKILLTETLKTIDSKDGAIFLINPDTQKLELTVSQGWFKQLDGLLLAQDEGINGYTFTNGQVYITPDVRKDNKQAQRVKDLTPINTSGGFFPILSSEGVIGVIDVFVPLPRMITSNEQRLLMIISQLAGNAIVRSRLHDRLRKSNMELKDEVVQRAAYQEMLAAEKELLTTTLMSLKEGVVMTDQEGLINLFNRAAESMTGYKIDEVVNEPLNTKFRLVNPVTNEETQDVNGLLALLNYVNETEGQYKAPMLIAKSGEKIFIEGSSSMLYTPGGYMLGYVIAFQDITEKLENEVQVALSQKMEAIGQLAAGIAHEINTPIQYIGDNLRFLQRTITRITNILNAYKDMVSKQKHILSDECIEEIEQLKKENRIDTYLSESPVAINDALDGVERVRKIVLAMREFSHPSEKEKKEADINHGIETTVVISRNEWKYFSDLETDLDPNLPMVYCQIDEINQVILNMIVNAAQSIQEKIPPGSEEKGKITIRTCHEDDKINILISDTGNGIPEEIRQRIFEPFFTTKGVGKGTGQGLSMAHNIIVNKHQGRIMIDSIVGKGTTFTIELPINPPQKE